MGLSVGKGVLLQKSISSVYTTIGHVVSVTPPTMEMEVAESTIITASAKTFLATVIDGGEVTFTVRYDPEATTHADCWTDFQAGTVDSWQLVLANSGASVVAWDAIQTTFPIDVIENNVVVGATFTLKVTGLPTITQ